MPKKQHTEAEIISALKQHECGDKTADICRKVGASHATFYTWKKQYAGLSARAARKFATRLRACTEKILIHACGLRTGERG
jgi:transposase